MKKTIVLLFLVLSMPFVFAIEAGVTPDSFWYTFDVLWDKIKLGLTFDKTKKAEIIIDVALERIEEAKQMSENQDEEASLKAQNEYLKSMEYIQKISTKANSSEKKDIEKSLDTHYEVMDIFLHENGHEENLKEVKNYFKKVKEETIIQEEIFENGTNEEENIEEPEPQKPLGHNFKLYLQIDTERSSINQVSVKFSKAKIFSKEHVIESKLTSKELVDISKDDPTLILSDYLVPGTYSKIELFIDSVRASGMELKVPGGKIEAITDIEILSKNITKYVYPMKFVSLGGGIYFDFVASTDLTYIKRKINELPECYEDSHCGDNWDCNLDKKCVYIEPEES